MLKELNNNYFRKPQLVFLLLVPLLLASCNLRHSPMIRKHLVLKDSVNNSDSQRYVNMYSIRVDRRDTTVDYNLDEYLFGKFYGNRASYYIIKDPPNKIYGQKIKSMTLFFLDGQLYKTEYALERNIAFELINNYHQFSIRGFNEYNRSIMESETVFFKNNKRWYLNGHLDNYDIQWRVGNERMILRVDESNKDEPYRYIVKSLKYDRLLYSIERTE